MRKINMLIGLLLLIPFVLADYEDVMINANVITVEEINTTANVNITMTNKGICIVLNETKDEVIPIKIGGNIISLNLSFKADTKREIVVNQEAKIIVSPENASITNINYSNTEKELIMVLNGEGTQEITIYSEDKPNTIKINDIGIDFTYLNKIINFTMHFSTPTLKINYPIPSTPSPTQVSGNGGGGGGGGYYSIDYYIDFNELNSKLVVVAVGRVLKITIDDNYFEVPINAVYNHSINAGKGEWDLKIGENVNSDGINFKLLKIIKNKAWLELTRSEINITNEIAWIDEEGILDLTEIQDEFAKEEAISPEPPERKNKVWMIAMIGAIIVFIILLIIERKRKLNGKIL